MLEVLRDGGQPPTEFRTSRNAVIAGARAGVQRVGALADYRGGGNEPPGNQQTVWLPQTPALYGNAVFRPELPVDGGTDDLRAASSAM